LSDIFGRKACLLSAYAIFGLGCLFCGLARNINELIAARVGLTIAISDKGLLN
jgi:MFS family permease